MEPGFTPVYRYFVSSLQGQPVLHPWGPSSPGQACPHPREDSCTLSISDQSRLWGGGGWGEEGSVISLVVQWLGLPAFTDRARVRFLVAELRSHRCGQKKKKRKDCREREPVMGSLLPAGPEETSAQINCKVTK